MERLKNDPLGQGPAQDREFFVPCICLEGLNNANQFKAFKRDQVLDVPCPCPYQIILQYMNSIPDPYGQIAIRLH